MPTPTTTVTAVHTGPSDGKNYGPALAMVTTLFFFWGFVTVLNDILVPHLKNIFDLSYMKVMLIQFAFFSAYFIFSLPAAKIIDAIGYKRTMVTGLVLMGVGALLFYPAASAPSYPLFLGALMVLAGGITLLQVAANPYVSVLGKPETASSRLNLTQAFNSFGTFIAPYIGGYLILNAHEQTQSQLGQLSSGALQAYRVQEAASVKIPYLGIAAFLFVFAIIIGLFNLPAVPGARGGESGAKGGIWKYRHLILGMVAIFVYVGAEVSIGSFLINYMSQPDIGNLSEFVAAKYVIFYWGGAMVGRFIGSFLLWKMKIPTGTLLGIFAIMAALLVCVSMLTSGPTAMWTILAVGLFNSIMFPSIFTLGIAELGPLTGEGSGLLVMAIVGGALIPVAQGYFADRLGIHHAFFLPVICYLYIVYYALKGSRPVVPAT